MNKLVVASSYHCKSILQDVLSVLDLAGNQLQFINKLNGELIAHPYNITDVNIWAICMYHAEVQPDMEGIMFSYNLSLCVRRLTFLHVLLTTTQLKLCNFSYCIRKRTFGHQLFSYSPFVDSSSLIRVFRGRILDSQECKVSSCGQRRL